jgi:hypothetical protein
MFLIMLLCIAIFPMPTPGPFPNPFRKFFLDFFPKPVREHIPQQSGAFLADQ